MRNIAKELYNIATDGTDSDIFNEDIKRFDEYFLESIYPEIRCLAIRGKTSFDFPYTFQHFSPDVCRFVFEAYGFYCEFYFDDEDRIYLRWQPFTKVAGIY